MTIRIRGACAHNLQDLDLDLPTGCLVALTGPSGSGKSTLAIDLLHREATRRLAEALPPALREALGTQARAEVRWIGGLPPSVAVLQEERAWRAAGTRLAGLTELGPLLARLAVLEGRPHCPDCDRPAPPASREEVVSELAALPRGTRVILLAPVAEARAAATLPALLETLVEAGYTRVRLDGALHRIEDLDPPAEGAHDLEVVVDRLRAGPDRIDRLREAVRHGMRAGGGRLHALVEGEERRWSEQARCPGCGQRLPPLVPPLFSPRSPVGACPACGGRGCTTCGGTGLGPVPRAVHLGGLGFGDWLTRPLVELPPLLSRLGRRPGLSDLAGEARARLEALAGLGLGHLPLARPISELATGELRRARLAAHLAADLSGILYVFDEPTAGLDDREAEAVARHLAALAQRGNTVLVVTHHRPLVEAADHVVELGPGGGPEGGRVVFSGPPGALARADTATARAWSAPTPVPRGRTPRGRLRLRGARGRNLAGVDLDLPLGCLVVLHGPSGAGKTTLLADTLVAALQGRPALPHDRIEGRVDRVVLAGDRLAAGGTGSVVATYVGAWTRIRRLLAATAEARVRGWGAATFSLARPGGRCEACRGEGVRAVDLAWLPDAEVRCEACNGLRFAPEVLEVRWRGASAADLLGISVREARRRFARHPRILRALDPLDELGLGYLPLGQPVRTLSGGEAWRLRLAAELAGARPEGLLLAVDEPSRGLHPGEIGGLVAAFQRLVDAGATVVVADTSPALAAAADRVIRLGPGGGPRGGRILQR